MWNSDLQAKDFPNREIKKRKKLKKEDEKRLKEQMHSPFHEDQNDIFFYIAWWLMQYDMKGIKR